VYSDALPQGTYSLNLDVSKYEKGIYVVSVYGEQGEKSIKLVIQ